MYFIIDIIIIIIYCLPAVITGTFIKFSMTKKYNRTLLMITIKIVTSVHYTFAGDKAM